MTKRTGSSPVSDHFKSYSKPEELFEVWILGTWDRETCEAEVVFTGDLKACETHKATSARRGDLGIRPIAATRVI